jgi:hypothetical protein
MPNAENDLLAIVTQLGPPPDAEPHVFSYQAEDLKVHGSDWLDDWRGWRGFIVGVTVPWTTPERPPWPHLITPLDEELGQAEQIWLHRTQHEGSPLAAEAHWSPARGPRFVITGLERPHTQRQLITVDRGFAFMGVRQGRVKKAAASEQEHLRDLLDAAVEIAEREETVLAISRATLASKLYISPERVDQKRRDAGLRKIADLQKLVAAAITTKTTKFQQ